MAKRTTSSTAAPMVPAGRPSDDDPEPQGAYAERTPERPADPAATPAGAAAAVASRGDEAADELVTHVVLRPIYNGNKAVHYPGEAIDASTWVNVHKLEQLGKLSPIAPMGRRVPKPEGAR
jgi:hypothetical protein